MTHSPLLNPYTLNPRPKTLNPKSENLKNLNPKALNPRALRREEWWRQQSSLKREVQEKWDLDEALGTEGQGLLRCRLCFKKGLGLRV